MFWSAVALADPIRLAVFHTELSRDGPGLMLRDILDGDPQVQAVEQVVQAVQPDILLLADIDYDLHGVAIAALAQKLGYPHWFAGRPNRGTPSGRDLDRNGRVGGPGDAEGFGHFAGQGGLAVLSKYPIAHDQLRDFTQFEWSSLPDAIAPEGPTPTYLSTTAHWDVPIAIDKDHLLRVLAWHATAPVFDGPEDLNGRRNHDEAMLWVRYLRGDLVWTPPRDFVLLGVANADLYDGESRPNALSDLIAMTQDAKPASPGARAAANPFHKGPAELDTVDWPEGPNRPGNLRVDYVLPAPHLAVQDSGVFWPAPDDPMAKIADAASRHKLVWVDIEIP